MKVGRGSVRGGASMRWDAGWSGKVSLKVGVVRSEGKCPKQKK